MTFGLNRTLVNFNANEVKSFDTLNLDPNVNWHMTQIYDELKIEAYSVF